MVVIMSNELYHHGILGQKWGKRNGPPYPLDASDHSASEKKAGWRNSLGKATEVDSKSSKTYNKKKIRDGKAIAKKILIGVGMVAAGAAIAYIVSSSGSGADKFDDDAYMKSLMLRYSGSDKKKLFTKDKRAVVAHHKFADVMNRVRQQMPNSAEPGDIYQTEYKGYVYTCVVNDDSSPKIVNYFKSSIKKRG